MSLPDGAELTAYLDAPADAPVTLVLVHGLSVTADLWRLHTPPLAAQGVRVVRYDQRAHGQSTRGTAPIRLGKLADDLSFRIDSCVPHGPLVLAGHSMGGMILQSLTTMRPDLLPRIQGLLLISTPDGPVTTRPVPGLRTRPLSWGRDLLALSPAPTPPRWWTRYGAACRAPALGPCPPPHPRAMAPARQSRADAACTTPPPVTSPRSGKRSPSADRARSTGCAPSVRA
ncbi:alpha/beta fold hydrolase [Streptomyces sp. NPDC047804]|uniref:alpha/beta fold hydrolase n=1 Tax=Streptomyces sp. NPDC047804 TaxID=3156663 RepID=UPI0033F8FD66